MSEFNPYAAPVAAAAPGGDVPARGEPQPWEVGEAIKGGWELYKAHWAPFTIGYFVVTLIGGIPGQVAPMLTLAGTLEEGSRAYYAVHVPLSFLGWLVAEFFMAGFTRAALRAVRTNDAAFGDFFGAGARYLAFVGMSFLKSLAIALGLLLFIVPGVIASLGFANAPFFVLDQNLGPIDALRASWEVSEGQKGNLFVLALAEVALTMLGVFACCLGLFVAVPVVMLARAIVYTRMSGTSPPPAPASAYGSPGPPGYPWPGPSPGPAP